MGHVVVAYIVVMACIVVVRVVMAYDEGPAATRGYGLGARRQESRSRKQGARFWDRRLGRAVAPSASSIDLFF